MSLLSRVFIWGKSEANAAMDHLEDPVKMAEQGIRNLNKDLRESLESLAKVKAQSIRAKKNVNREKEAAADYEKKAMMLLTKAQQGSLDGSEADRLAAEALSKRDGAVERASTLSKEASHMEQMTAQLEQNIQTLKHQVSKWENELRTLQARAQVSQATRKMNEQLANVDSSSTISMLERMRDKVQEEESLAEAYGEMASVDKSIDDEIERALDGAATADGSDALVELKSRMGSPLVVEHQTPELIGEK
jgi:phage shock protein A